MKKVDTLRAIFGGYPCKGFDTLTEAIPCAEKLPDGLRIVWLLSLCGDQKYMITRKVEQVALYDEAPTCTRAWENGRVLIPPARVAPPRPLPSSPPENSVPKIEAIPSEHQVIVSPKAKKPIVQESPVGSGSISIPALIASLKAADVDAETILKIIADSCK
jgi:hypothetical protein